MVKMLLSAVLVATQVLSWNASPLFLCLSADGSICVDFGPDDCDCCQHAAAAGECSGGHEACHDHGQVDPAGSDKSDPCGCDHILISEPQAATLVRPVATPDASHQVVSPAAVCDDRASACCLATTRDVAHAQLWGRDAPSAALVLLAPVVMQC